MTPAPTRLVVLGGGSDIARACIDALAPKGLRSVVLAGRPGGSRDTAAGSVRSDHGAIDVATADFDASATDTHTAALEAIDAEHGPFDTVMVAFGDLGDPFTLDVDPTVAADLAHVNYVGAISATLAAINVLRGEPNARVIVFSSIAAVRPRVGNLIYGSAKAGLDAFAVEVAAPAKKLGVSVITVRPGFVHTRMTQGLDPAPLATTADEVAADLVEGLEKGRALIHSPRALAAMGQVLKNLPGPIWRRLSAR